MRSWRSRREYGENRSDFSLSPNPAKGTLNIATTTGTIENVVVFNAMGLMVGNFTETGCNAATVDVSAWAPGVYAIEVKGANHLVLGRKKVVVRD